MDWDDLRIFLAVARSESLSGAGKLLRIDPATVGRRIARLEGVLSTRLFTKTPQGYTLTRDGQRLMDPALAAEVALASAQDCLRKEDGGLTGQIRLGAPDGVANYLLPQVLAGITAQNPGLEVQLVALPRVFNLSKREADMAVAVSCPETGRLTVQKLTDYHLHLAASREYLSQNPAITCREDLQDHRIIGYIPDMIFDKELDYLGEIGAASPEISSNSVSVQTQLMRAGGGVGMVHDFALPFAPELVHVLPQDISLTRSFWLVRHADDAQIERLNRFAELLAGGVRRELHRLEALT
ncbi:LysR family transcriptional regulator (plasmid) [Pseudorhodobacter turbinis]|uniref:LysR family transcriptional regulator n=1 Tax=Pseudorhodobacter turbinis TaxID=2500533 RepID=A0A4P8EI05_9RHOB|nr:LysR family transcriptional regulator [Pseudorhodobacter turbinis]QCO56790.1 LysR family transcriptional regulator [Pseudorhodobacter turbinis]